MAKRLGTTPFREILAHSIADDPALAVAAQALDAVLDKSVAAIPHILLFAHRN